MKTPSRSGKTLIEMVLVIAVMGMVMTISANTMVVVLNRERSGSDVFLASSDRARLASDLRRDVNAAQSAIVKDSAVKAAEDKTDSQLDLTMPSKRLIEYGIQGLTVTRRVKQGEKIVGRDEYHIDHHQAHFVLEAGNRDQVSLVATITHRPDKFSVPQRQFRIDAVTGKDLRFQESEGAP